MTALRQTPPLPVKPRRSVERPRPRPQTPPVAQSLTPPVTQSVDPGQQSVTRSRTSRRQSATDRRRYGDATRRLVTYVTERVDARIQSVTQDAGTSVALVVALVMGASLPRVAEAAGAVGTGRRAAISGTVVSSSPCCR